MQFLSRYIPSKCSGILDSSFEIWLDASGRSTLTEIDLREAKMQNTIFEEANLTNANLQRASAPQLQVHLLAFLLVVFECVCVID